MRSEVDELKRFAIADILSVSGKQKTTETINMHINTIIDIAFLKGQQAQQSKVDELQKKNAWLSDVACRENKRANKLQEENVNTTVLLGKTIQEKNELQKQRDSFIKAYEIEMDKSIELQKRLDAVKTLIEEYRDPPTEDKTFRHALSIVAYELEQALKGGSDEAK